VALAILADVRRGVPFDAALTRELGTLPDADRRLAHEMAVGVLRQSQPLDDLLARFVARGVSSVAVPLLDILRLGTYQLRLLDRIPPHAAVATSVALARELVGERASGFTNAILRRVAELPTEDTAHDDVDDVARLASRWTHPAWLVARWIARFGVPDTEELLRWNNSHPVLVLQPTRGSILDLEQLLDEHGIANHPAPFAAGVVVSESRPDRLPGFDAGDFFVQDPAQALVVRFADFAPDATVFDACAAPGGKTLALTHQHAQVIAADLSVRRLARVRENLLRAGRHTEAVIAADAAHPPIRPVRAYLLDAPCLGTGSFARHPDARLRVSNDALLRLAAAQAILLDAAASRIAPGGVLCYATCSLEPEENEMQVNAFLHRHPGFRREPPAGFPAELLTPAGDLLALPQRDRIDGAFAARLVRSG
jgi:16S rRNA (cytosine967-C5)-methyltransferase